MTARTSSLVHPKYKTKYSVGNWREYEQGLRARGDVMIWFSEDAIAGWIARGKRNCGAQRWCFSPHSLSPEAPSASCSRPRKMSRHLRTLRRCSQTEAWRISTAKSMN